MDLKSACKIVKRILKLKNVVSINSMEVYVILNKDKDALSPRVSIAYGFWKHGVRMTVEDDSFVAPEESLTESVLPTVVLRKNQKCFDSWEDTREMTADHTPRGVQ